MRRGEERARRQKDQPRGQPYLQRTAQQRRSSKGDQLAQRELNADRKHEQDDAQLGQDLDVFVVVDQAEAARSRQHAGQEQADHRRNAQPAACIQYADRQRQHDQQVAQQGNVQC
jgi:hypothetical protein